MRLIQEAAAQELVWRKPSACQEHDELCAVARRGRQWLDETQATARGRLYRRASALYHDGMPAVRDLARGLPSDSEVSNVSPQPPAQPP